MVTFIDYNNTVLKTEYVEHGKAATAPEIGNRYGYAFTGWSIDFTNVTSNITTVAQYKAISVFYIKENNTWTNIGKIYKKVSSSWVEQENDNWSGLFNTNFRYVKGETPISPTAILYSDGTLVFSNYSDVDNSYGDVVSTFTGWDTARYDTSYSDENNKPYPPWNAYKASIINVYTNYINPKYLRAWFYQCDSIKNMDLSNLDTSNVNDMGHMFSTCKALTSLDLSNFDTSNVNDMGSMFAYCYNLQTINLNNFDTSNVIDMGYMFQNCEALTSFDLSNFGTSNVTDMAYMFSGCKALTSLDLSNFDTSNVTDMKGMFAYCYNLQTVDLSNFDTSNVNSMYYMFAYCTNLQTVDLSSFDISNVITVDKIFYNCTNLQTIYVKDETAKNKIESSTNFPSTATIIVGKPS